MTRAADLLTSLRVVLAPMLAWQMALPRHSAGLLPLAVYLVAAASDMGDGALARATGSASRRGRVFDHGADACLLFPTFAVLAWQGRLPAALPLAAVTAFALYVADGWRRGGGFATMELTSSRSGALGGVLNYVVVGAAAAAAPLDVIVVDRSIYAAACVVAAINLAAACERVSSLLTPARALPLEGTPYQEPRSSP